MSERFPNNSADVTQSGRNGYIPTPSDTVELPVMSRQLLILSDGTLSVVFAGYPDEGQPVVADAVTFDVVAGQAFPWTVRYIAAATTASVLVVY